MLIYQPSLLKHLWFFGFFFLIQEDFRRMCCNLEKNQKNHVPIHPLGTAHVQTPNPPILPEASPISFSSMQCCSLRHISSVRRRGEAGRQRLWRTSPTGSDATSKRCLLVSSHYLSVFYYSYLQIFGGYFKQ